jgi:hypothetical protein
MILISSGVDGCIDWVDEKRIFSSELNISELQRYKMFF